MEQYRKLDPEEIVETLAILQLRIEERFPSAGLTKVCGELTEIARGARENAGKIAAPNLWLRAGTAAIIVVGLLLLYYVGGIIKFKHSGDNFFGVLQGIEAMINLLIIMGAGILFLTTVESRWKRHQALLNLYELRSIVHVIDMHQLTKDPSATAVISSPTRHSPVRTLKPFELMRYLDYASEMLSLSAKIGVLYAQGFRDPVVLEAVSDLGQLTSNLTNKMWQKITMIQTNENWKTETAERARRRLAKADPSRWVIRSRAPSKDDA